MFSVGAGFDVNDATEEPQFLVCALVFDDDKFVDDRFTVSVVSLRPMVAFFFVSEFGEIVSLPARPELRDVVVKLLPKS